jgi:hypothetical protein
MEWIKLCPPNSSVEVQTPVPHTVTIFGDRLFKEIMKVK